ncbi:MAG: serine/threonine protein kinase [Clostridiales bacterium]|nr:serine/threonine protein kinase [Clostridiales bacterium]
MDNLTKYKLSLFKDIRELNDKGTVILSYSLSNDRMCVKKTVNNNTAEIYKRIKGSENGLLPKIYDIIDCEDSCIVVEEYIKGKSVENIISEVGAIDEKTACGYIADVLKALDGVHSLNIIHRDISPGNVIIDETGKARLLDFDIARTAGKPQSTDTVILGTAGFASPEQYGFAQTDRRSDIYSVGALFNYMLTGTIVQMKIYNKMPVCAVIIKAVSFEPNRRYSNCGDMLSEECFNDYISDFKGEMGKKNIGKKNRGILSHIPGFRTHKLYKTTAALGLYGLIILAVICEYAETGNSGAAGLMLVHLLILFVYPMWWFGNYGKQWDILPFMKKLNPFMRNIAAAAVYLAVLLVLCTVIP